MGKETTSVETASIAPSEATTLVNEDVRTNIHGQPIKYTHDNMTSMMLGDGGAGLMNIGANTLPHGYTDRSLVRIPIKISDYLESSELAIPSPPRRRSFLNKLSDGLGSSSKKDEGTIRAVAMSRGDYLKYWAKGNDGKFLPSVVEPSEGRAEWLRRQFDFDDHLRRQDAELNKNARVFDDFMPLS